MINATINLETKHRGRQESSKEHRGGEARGYEISWKAIAAVQGRSNSLRQRAAHRNGRTGNITGSLQPSCENLTG